jgi:hypothetical protein
LIPFYGLLSEDYTSYVLQDAYSTIRKALKPLQDKMSADGDIIPSEKLQDFFKVQADLKTLSGDHLDILKSRYLETKKAVKPLSIYFNLKKLLEDAQESTKVLLKQTSGSNMGSTRLRCPSPKRRQHHLRKRKPSLLLPLPRMPKKRSRKSSLSRSH